MNLAWLIPAVLAPGAAMAAHTLWRERHRLPAAPDNVRGIDPELLWTCRHIATATRRETP